MDDPGAMAGLLLVVFLVGVGVLGGLVRAQNRARSERLSEGSDGRMVASLDGQFLRLVVPTQARARLFLARHQRGAGLARWRRRYAPVPGVPELGQAFASDPSWAASLLEPRVRELACMLLEGDASLQLIPGALCLTRRVPPGLGGAELARWRELLYELLAYVEASQPPPVQAGFLEHLAVWRLLGRSS